MPERREQLQQATDEFASFPERIYLENCRRYQCLQSLLLHFLATHTDTIPFFEQLVHQITPFLTEENQVWLKELVAQGEEIITTILPTAQNLLHELEALQLIEVCRFDRYGDLIKTDLLPLLPVISTEDQESFFEYLLLLGEWHQDLVDFLRGQR